MKIFGMLVLIGAVLGFSYCSFAGDYIERDIITARKMLKNQKAGFSVRNGKIVSFNTLLIVKRGNKMKQFCISSVGNLPLGITRGRKNGVATEYIVDQGATLASKRVVHTDSGFEEVVYTPFSQAINKPELRKKGLKYLRLQFKQAKDDLRAKKIMSRAYPGILASNVIPENVALVLSIIEHIDPAEFDAAVKTKSVSKLIDKVLVTIAANQAVAYRYSVSPAGARGLNQFIPPTYRSIVRMYPKAELIPDPVAGMNHHTNGAKASLLLFDADLASTTKQYRAFVRKHPKAMGRFLASAYNCGKQNTVRAIKEHGAGWATKVPRETCNYLLKFDAVAKQLQI